MALSDKGFANYSFENQRRFTEILKKAARKVGDLSPAFRVKNPFGGLGISGDFYKSQKAIFQLSGPGGYRDLSPQYKIQKQRAVGFTYPILKRKGKLERAVSNPNAEGSINIIEKDSLTIGASLISKGKSPIDYVNVHNSDAPRTKIPQRKMIFVGPEVRSFAQKDRQNKGGRLTRWSNIIEVYVQGVFKAQGLA